MGLDFIKTVAPAFQKAWKNGRDALATPELFTVKPARLSQSVVVDLPADNVPFSVGAELVVQADGTRLLFCQETILVAVLEGAPDDLLRYVEGSGAVLGVVERINPYSSTADVVIS